MGFSYRAKKVKNSGLNVSTSKDGLNVSYTVNLGFIKFNVPIIGKFKKVRASASSNGMRWEKHI